MSTHYGRGSIRAAFERAFAGVVFTAMTVFVMGGAIAMCI